MPLRLARLGVCYRSVLMASGLRELALVVGAALVTVLGADLLLQRVAPVLPRRMEAADGIRLLENGDPETLLIGSSHGRSFLGIASSVAASSKAKRTMVSIPVEYGKISSYEWILDHRVRPLLDEVGPDGRPVRKNLRRLIVVTEWWDACSPEGGLAFNVPARGFVFSDFASDLFRHGLNPWNQNYIDEKIALLFQRSTLLQDRGVGRILQTFRERLGLRSSGEQLTAEKERTRLQEWRRTVEKGATDPRCHDGTERAALERILDWAQGRSLDVTLLLFPRKPATLTDKARATTLASFGAEMNALATKRGIRFVDYTVLPVIDDTDFMADFDHVTAAGNQKLANWALAHELAFLLEPAPPPGAAASPVGP